MKKLILLTVIFSSLVACGKNKSTVVDPELQPYLDQFKAEGESRGKTLKMSSGAIFVDHLEVAGRNAECDFDTQTVLILREYWKNNDEAHRKALVYHELGHCELGLDHNEEKFKPNPTGSHKAPVSIMFPTPDTVAEDWHLEEHYLDELFSE